jgi:hypothetical protein
VSSRPQPSANADEASVSRWRLSRRQRRPEPEIHFWQEPLTPDQLRLLQLMATTFFTRRKWPTWQGLRNELDLGPDPTADVFHSLPRIKQMIAIYGAEYGYVRTSERTAGRIGLQDDVRLALTVAGWWRTGHQAVVQQFLAILAAAVRKWRDSQPDITESVQVTFTHEDVPDLGNDASALTKDDLFEVLEQEPPFWWGGNKPDDNGWFFYLSAEIERYASVTTVEDYLAAVNDYAEDRNRLAGQLVPVVQQPVQPESAQAPRLWSKLLKAAAVGVATLVIAGIGEWAKGDVIKILEWTQRHVLGF